MNSSTPDDLDTVAAALEQAGRPVHLGTRAECDSRRTRGFIASSDPSGNKLEILARPYNSGGKSFPGRQVGITNFSHVALFSTDTKRDTEFWTRLVNARVSDWLGEATFLRIGTVIIYRADAVVRPPGIQHINHQVEDIDDVMQSYYWLKQPRREDHLRPRPPSDLHRDDGVFRRPRRHGLRILRTA